MEKIKAKKSSDNIHKIAGTVVAIFTVITSICIYIYTVFYKVPDLEISMKLRYRGYFLTIENNGNDVSKDVYLRVVFWRHGAPAPDYENYEQIRDLPPKSDYSLRINFWEEAVKHGHKEGKNLHEFGYIVVSCSNMRKPKAYAFHVCYNAFSDNENPCKIETDEQGYVSLARFSYPEEAPHIGQAINYPVE